MHIFKWLFIHRFKLFSTNCMKIHNFMEIHIESSCIKLHSMLVDEPLPEGVLDDQHHPTQ
jgi:hypothetical protein